MIKASSFQVVIKDIYPVSPSPSSQHKLYCSRPPPSMALTLQTKLLLHISPSMATSFPISFSLLSLLLVPPLPVSSQSSNNDNNRNISLGSSLTTASNPPWTSPSGDFAFGFQQITTDGYLLAVVFDKVPEKTVVWSANRNNLVPAGSNLELAADGRLLLTDPSGRVVWTAAGRGRPASHAAMLDTGNFIVAANDSSILWQSFQAPTDTLLPTQTLERGSQLIAKYSKFDYSDGRFNLVMQPDGNLLMYTLFYPQTGVNYPYWSAANTLPASGFRLVFNEFGSVNLINSTENVLAAVFDNGGSRRDFYWRVTLDYDGVLRYYTYRKRNDTGGNWNGVLFRPGNICLAIDAIQGNGACGYNSYCEFENAGLNPICKCPVGYVFLDPSDESRGCIQDFAPEDCRLMESDAFDLVPMTDVNWRWSDYDVFVSAAEDWCVESCLSDCRCALVVHDNNGNCFKKRSPLSNGRVEDGMPGRSFVKVRRSNSTASSPPVYSEDKKNGEALVIVGSVLLASSAVVLLLSASTFMFLFRKKKSSAAGGNDWLSRNLRSFSFHQLELATGGFKEVLGSGASGTVYRGVLPGNQQLVAVKRLDKSASETQDQEFETELKVIGGTNHRNLVKLVGFCNEGLNRVLVYEFMSNGSLADLLFDGDGLRPRWCTRTEIAYAVARGLVYLHEECNTQIIHCDVKPRNVLLDESMTAKISDFGLAKLLKENQTRTITGIRGTKGYVAPEWFRNMPITTKIDVYSFGILLLELVCCRDKMEAEAENEEEVILAEWAYDCYDGGRMERLVENDGEAVADMEKVERFVKIAIWCIQDDSSLRPTMKKVVRMLEDSVHVPAPPNFTSSISAI